MQIESVCILGGTGFVGQAVAEHVYERGLRVKVLTRSVMRARPLTVLPTLEVAVGDPHDEATLVRQFEGVDAVVNLVGILHERGGQGFEKVHVELPRKVVGACRAAGVRQLVQMSALGASPEGPSDYQRSKAQGEAAVRSLAMGLAWTIIRPSVIFGEHDRFLNLFAGMARWFPVIPLARAECRIQPVWVEDVARAIAALIGDKRLSGETLELCGPRAYTLLELAQFAARMAGRAPAILALPEWAGMMQASVFERLPGKLLTRDNLLSLGVDNVCGCPFPEILGFKPAAIEAVVPDYIRGASSRTRYNLLRYRAGR